MTQFGKTNHGGEALEIKKSPHLIHLVAVVGGENANLIILDHFISHYRKLGVDRFHLFVHNNPQFYSRLLDLGIKCEGILTHFTETIKCQIFNEVIENIGLDDWCLTCDMDEFHDYGEKSFKETVEGQDCDFVFGNLIDRFSPDGFIDMLPDTPLMEQFPISASCEELMGAVYAKILAVRRGVTVILGHHFLAEVGHKGLGPFKVNHYKWDASVLARLQKERGNPYSNLECQKFLAARDDGRLRKVIGLKPKILFISHEASRTGAPLVLLYLMRHLKQNTDLEFDLLVKCVLGHRDAILPEFSELAKVYIWPEYNKASLGYNLIYCNTSTVHDVVSAMPYKCYVISHIHEMYSTLLAFGYSIPHMLKRTHTYIPVSNPVARDLVKLGVETSRLIIPPIGGPISLPEGVCKCVDKNDVFTVGFSGTCCLRKGFDFLPLLIKLVSERLPKEEFKMVWVGNINLIEGLVDDVKEKLRADGLENNLVLTGEVTNPFPIYETFDLFILLSREDPFPLCGLEAAALKIPIMCFSEVCGLDMFIGEDAGVVVPSFDLGAMADNIVRIKNDSQLRENMAIAAEKKSRQYTTQVICSKIEHIIKTSIEQHLECSLIIPIANIKKGTRGKNLGSRISRKL